MFCPSISPDAKKSWKDSFDSYEAVQVGRGSSGSVLRIDDDLVIKVFAPDEDGMLDFERERDIFEQLQFHGHSKHIVRYVEHFGEAGIVLEHLGDTLRKHLHKEASMEYQVYRWTREACEGLAFLHDAGVFHGDVGCHNFLMDNSGGIKLCDFAGSRRDGEEARVCYEVRSQHPLYESGDCTLSTEIFALGSLIFEIILREPPYASEPGKVVREKFEKGQFPLFKIEDFRMQRIIRKCWQGEYRDVHEVIKDIPSYRLS